MILFKLEVDGFTGGDDERTGGSRQTATIASLAPGAELRSVPTYRPARTLQLYATLLSTRTYILVV